MLRSLRFKNYCQHRGERSFELYGRTIGIVGPNGSGKSNLARAISDSLTGKYHKAKSRIITIGESEGWTELTFDAGSKILTVHRDLHSKEAWIHDAVSDDYLADTARGVNQVIQESLQVPPEVLEELIFVEQKAINDLLFSKDAERERIAQSFFGVSNAREIEAALGALLSEIPQDFDPALPQEIADLLARIRETDQEVRTLSEAIRTGSEQLLPEDTRSEYVEMIKTTNLVINATQCLSELNVERGNLECDEEDLLTQRELLRKQLAGRTLENIQTRLADVVKVQKSEQTRSSLRLQLIACKKELDDLQGRLAEIGDLEVRRAACANALAEKRSTEAVFIIRQQLLISSEEGSTQNQCPVCFGSVGEDRTEEMVLQNREESLKIAELSISIEDLESIYANARDRKGNLISQIHTLEHSIQSLCEELSRILPSPFVNGEKENQLQAELVDVNTLLHQISICDGRLLSISTKKSMVLDGIEKATESLRFRSYTIDQIEAASVAVEMDDVRLSELCRIEGEVSTKQQLRRMLVESLSQKRVKLESQRRNAEKRDFVSRVRSRFHYTGAPQRVIQSRLSTIGDRINYYLELLGTNYRIEVREGLRFECIFREKRVDASDLSGGEMVDLSNSFRLASSESFCSRIGFMILDEPTTWLDNRTVDRMASVIERLSEIGGETGQQFIFVTHSMPLVSFFDQVIEMT